MKVSASAADWFFFVGLFVVFVDFSLAVRAGLRRRQLGAGSSLVQQVETVPDGLQRAVHFGLESDQHFSRVIVGAAPDLLAFGVGLSDDLVAHLLGLPGQLTFLYEVRCLLLGTGEDLLRLFAGLLEQSLDLGVDALGVPYFFGDCHTQLVDQIECIRLIDDNAAGQGKLAAAGDLLFEFLNQEDDVRRTGPPQADFRGGCRISAIIDSDPRPTVAG